MRYILICDEFLVPILVLFTYNEVVLAETLERVNSATLHHFMGFQSGNTSSFSSVSGFSLR